jgi:hypothetical protein
MKRLGLTHHTMEYVVIATVVANTNIGTRYLLFCAPDPGTVLHSLMCSLCSRAGIVPKRANRSAEPFWVCMLRAAALLLMLRPQQQGVRAIG